MRIIKAKDYDRYEQKGSKSWLPCIPGSELHPGSGKPVHPPPPPHYRHLQKLIAAYEKTATEFLQGSQASTSTSTKGLPVTTEPGAIVIS